LSSLTNTDLGTFGNVKMAVKKGAVGGDKEGRVTCCIDGILVLSKTLRRCYLWTNLILQ
jgi:hypothetical protein